jgi:hypothetical protein
VPVVNEYKYLGVPLDQAFTLKHLYPLLKKKISRFSFRIRAILHSILGTNAKYNLWQIYVRCYFDYFAPAIALCGHTKKYKKLFTKSLKKALNLPLQTSNSRTLEAIRCPSLTQIGAYHISYNLEKT